MRKLKDAIPPRSLMLRSRSQERRLEARTTLMQRVFNLQTGSQHLPSQSSSDRATARNRESFSIARFVHLTDARLAKRIRRGGLRAPSGRDSDGFVYCVPVTSHFFQTYQWGRELKRGGYRSSIAVTFVIPDTEVITVSRFGAASTTMTAAEAVALFASGDDVLGHQVMIGRKIEPSEIRSIRPAPAIVGWRFYPEAKGQHTLYQPPGTIKARRVRARIEARFASWYD